MQGSSRSRAAQIRELVFQHVEPPRPEGPSVEDDAPLDEVLEQTFEGVRALVEELTARRAAAAVPAEAERRLQELMDVILALVGFDYKRKAPVSDKDDIFDGMAVGLNILGEELATSTVSKAFVDDILESMSDGLFVVRPDSAIQMLNRAACELTGYGKAELIGAPLSRLFPLTTASSLIASGGARDQERACQARGGSVIVSFSASTMHDRKGEIYGVVCVARDLTESKRLEEERWRLREAVARQSVLLEELSAPIIPVTHDILVVPLIGTLDERRAAQMLELLLKDIVRRKARVAIVDITGVRSMSAQSIEGLLQAVRSARLVGAEVVLTGIRPEVAVALVGLEADLDRVATFGVLQSGMAYALKRTGSSGAL